MRADPVARPRLVSGDDRMAAGRTKVWRGHRRPASGRDRDRHERSIVDQAHPTELGRDQDPRWLFDSLDWLEGARIDDGDIIDDETPSRDLLLDELTQAVGVRLACRQRALGSDD